MTECFAYQVTEALGRGTSAGCLQGDVVFEDGVPLRDPAALKVTRNPWSAADEEVEIRRVAGCLPGGWSPQRGETLDLTW